MRYVLFVFIFSFGLTSSLTAESSVDGSMVKDTVKYFSGIKKSQFLSSFALVSAVAAIGCDVFVETNYQRYEDSKDSLECVKYRGNVISLEKARDIFLYTSVGTFITSIIFKHFENKAVTPRLRFLEGGGVNVEIAVKL